MSKNKFILRISSGEYRGKGLFSPGGSNVRPTSARVKDSLFNILRCDLNSSKFLDLFAGSGQIGLEAASNGALVTMADKDTSTAKLNAEHVGADNVKIIDGEYASVLDRFLRAGEKFDFIFADPPYSDGLYEDIIAKAIPLLSKDGKLILEHSSDSDFSKFGQTRRYGSRSLTFIGGKE